MSASLAPTPIRQPRAVIVPASEDPAREVDFLRWLIDLAQKSQTQTEKGQAA